MTTDVACRICGARDGEPLVLRERQFGTNEEFEYSRCRGCGTLQLARIPEDLGRHYPAAYYAFGSRITWKRRASLVVAGGLFRLGGGRLVARLTRRLGLDEILAVLPPPPARILDVGSGNGYLIRQLRWFGYRCAGIDPYIHQSKRVGGVMLWKKELPELAGEQFDVVMMHHSLEHVPDPHRTLADIVPLLAPGGRVIIRVPVIPNNVWDEFGTDWPQLDAPRHIHTFSLRGLETLAERHGFRVASVRYDATPWSLIAARVYRNGGRLVDLGPQDFIPSAEDQAVTDRANVEGRGDQVCVVLDRAT